MSGVGKWALGVGLVALATCVGLSLSGLVTVATIAGIVAFLGLGIAGYDALYEWTARLRRDRESKR